jgi:hypothetical protein
MRDHLLASLFHLMPSVLSNRFAGRSYEDLASPAITESRKCPLFKVIAFNNVARFIG